MKYFNKIILASALVGSFTFSFAQKVDAKAKTILETVSKNYKAKKNETMADVDVDTSADEKIGTDEDTPEKSDLYNDIPGSKEIAKAIECANEKNVDIKNSHILEDAVAAYQSGDDTAFDILYKEYRPKFERFAIRMKDDDAVQELSIALIKAADAF
jgi:hypothetical protein